ncbi:hypothetical protein [Mucilaginibacter sp.]
MKNINKLLSVGLLFMMVLIVSCGKKPKEQIVQTWQVNGIKTETKLPEAVKNSMIANSKMTFTKDGQYTTTGGIGADAGTYVLDEDGKNLSTTSTAGKASSAYTIDKLDNDNLVLTNQGNTVTCIAVK